MTMSQANAAVFGKLPSRRDFIREGATDIDTTVFEGWLVGAVERSRGELPKGPVRLMLPQGDDQPHLLGTWVPSQDAVGRSFPLCCLFLSSRDLCGIPWHCFFPLYGAAFEAAEALLTSAVAGEGGALHALFALEQPHASRVPNLLHEADRAMSDDRLGTFAQRVYGASAENLWYALATLLSLDASHPAVLDVPAPDDFDLFVWLALVRQALRRPEAPGVLWSSEAGRALVMPAEAWPQSLAVLLNPRHTSPERWPLWTDKPSAIADARAALPPTLREAVSSDVSLRELVEVFTREASA